MNINKYLDRIQRAASKEEIMAIALRASDDPEIPSLVFAFILMKRAVERSREYDAEG